MWCTAVSIEEVRRVKFSPCLIKHYALTTLENCTYSSTHSFCHQIQFSDCFVPQKKRSQCLLPLIIEYVVTNHIRKTFTRLTTWPDLPHDKLWHIISVKHVTNEVYSITKIVPVHKLQQSFQMYFEKHKLSTHFRHSHFKCCLQHQRSDHKYWNWIIFPEHSNWKWTWLHKHGLLCHY